MQAQAQITGFSGALRGAALQQRAGSRRAPAAPQAVQAATMQTRRLKVGDKATPKPPPPPSRKPVSPGAGTMRFGGGKAAQGGKGGTKVVGVGGGTRKISAIEVGSKERLFRQKQGNARPVPRVLSRIQQLKLLSKLEQSGLLSLLERQGLTLSKLEQSGALSAAERLGVVSLLADRNFPGSLYALAAVLLAAGPVAVYFMPDTSSGLVALQGVVALACIAGGSAAWGGASLLTSLQKS